MFKAMAAGTSREDDENGETGLETDGESTSEVDEQTPDQVTSKTADSDAADGVEDLRRRRRRHR